MFRSRRTIRDTFFLLLLLITVFIFFSSVWLALFLSKQITRPVEALADAMDKIAAGKYNHRVLTIATGEMGDLVNAFNHMAADLETSRALAESSSAQLTAANQAVEERRRELETIVETIPSGVVTLDGSGSVLQSNRAFAILIGRHADASLAGEPMQALLPAECWDDLAGVIRRGQRMGAASTEIELPTRTRTIHLSVTSARLELAPGQPGTVLVGRRYDGAASRPAPARLEGSRAARGPRNQEPAHAHRAIGRAQSAAISSAARPIPPKSSANAAK